MRKVRNSFCRPPGHDEHGSGPEFYTYHSEPIEYRGHEIFCVVQTKLRNGRPWAGQYDVVKNDVCIHQRVTLDGAKKAVDELLERESAT